jgi:ubiquinone/menaquinone biosynthesis C-methylase UbiE
MKDTEIKKKVREGYARVATKKTSCCAPTSSCCGGSLPETISKSIGYSEAELGSVPDGANLGLGCGNPVALASLKEGETVLDLGSGAGFDCFLAANKVGKAGRVIGVDMTPEMLDKARQNARKGKYGNVEFRRGEIEKLPVEDNYVDVIISNCVINLSPDKLAVFREAFRVLKPGGRLMVSDIVLLAELPDFIKESVAAYVGCISGAMLKDDYLGAVKAAGFKDVKVTEEATFPIESMANDPTAQVIMKEMKITPAKVKELGQAVLSVKVQAVKGK